MRFSKHHNPSKRIRKARRYDDLGRAYKVYQLDTELDAILENPSLDDDERKAVLTTYSKSVSEIYSGKVE